MAEIRNPVSIPSAQTGRVAPAARVEAARAAQRAFFNAALSGEAPTTEAPMPAQSSRPTIKPTPAAPDARLRPGSIIDIKV